MSDKRRHAPVRTENGWWCSECLKSWKSKPRSICHGATTYTWWEQAPEHFKTKTQLGKEGLKPGPLHRAYMDTTKYKGGHYKLFDVTEAVPKRKVSAAQKRVLERARVAANEKRRTCSGCKRVVLRAYDLRDDGICYSCIEAEFEAMRKEDKAEAVRWARQVLARDLVILDLETTQLESAEAVQIGVLAKTGKVLFDQLVKPDLPITEGAAQVHGIRDGDVENAPRFVDVADDFLETLRGKTVVVYNLEFDKGVLRRELERAYLLRNGFAHHYEGLPARISAFQHWALPNEYEALSKEFVTNWFSAATWEDAMEPYAAFVGQWHEYWGNYTWQPLLGDHQAIGDCRACLELLQAMAAYALPSEPIPVETTTQEMTSS